MPCKIDFPCSGNIVEVRLSGEISSRTIEDMHAELFYGTRWRTGMNLLVIVEEGSDPSGMSLKKLRQAFRNEVERLHALRGPDYKVAWVAEDTRIEPVLRDWQSMPFVDGAYDLEIFRDRESARKWLKSFEADWPDFLRPLQSQRRL